MSFTMDPQTNDLLKKVWESLESLGNKIGDGAEIGWHLMVKKVFWVDGAIPTILGALTLLILVSTTIWFWKKYPKWNYEIDHSDASTSLFLVGIFGTAIALVVSMMAIGGIVRGITHMIIPEFYAIKQIIEMFK